MQNLDCQVDQLRAAGASQIFNEEISGSTRNQSQLEEVLRYQREGNQLIVTSMDCLARCLMDLQAIVGDLVGRGVPVRFLRVGQTYSAKANPIAELMLGSTGSVAEFESCIIKDRQAEGIARAKVLTDAQVVQAKRWLADGLPKAEVARRLGIGRTTLYKYLANGVG